MPSSTGEALTLYSTNGEYGLRVLADPTNADLDIVFVPGLTGNRETTWSGNLESLWPRDILSADLPTARIMTFGYDADVVRAIDIASSNRIRDHAQTLARELARKRSIDGCERRSLIFVAHSLGGLVCEQALLISRGATEDWINVLLPSTAGILFLGTPHAGSNLADWANVLMNISRIARPTNKALVDVLRPGSEMLANIQQEFHSLLDQRQTRRDSVPRIHCFFEELAYVHGIGPIVPRHSAILTRYGNEGIHANHVSMTKFKHKNDQGYQAVAGQLRIWAREIEQRRTEQFPAADSSRDPNSWSAAGVSTPSLGHVYSRTVHSVNEQLIHGSVDSVKDERPYMNGTSKKDLGSVVPSSQIYNPCLKPMFNIPFSRDNKFIGRESILTEMQQRRQEIDQGYHFRLALVGLGGIGKSQIAIEYAYRIRCSEPQTSVFWIHASNSARFEQGYGEIALKAKIPGRDDHKADIPRLVYEWLSDGENGRWILILDNVDDDRIFFQSSEDGKPPLESFLPQIQQGSILVTSRNDAAATNLVGAQNLIRVKSMDDDDSLALLKTRTVIESPSEADAARELIRDLERLPLAIIHAGAYISTRAPRITIADYLNLFRKSEKNQKHLLSNAEMKDIRRDPSTRHPVITTWQVSFGQIKETTPEAADLLALMSMFDRQSIPEDLLHDGKDQLEFEDSIAPLLSFSLITADINRQSFEIHRLVQLSMIKWLEIMKELEVWRTISIRILAKTFPNGEYENWIMCEKILPHAKNCLAYAPIDGTKLDLGTLANNSGWYLSCKGRYKEAETLCRQALKAREKALGPDHPETLISADNLGWLLNCQGKYREAKTIHRQVLRAREKVLGLEHPSTLTSVDNLGLVLGNQNEDEEAELMHRRALTAKEKVLGLEHPETLASVNNLSLVLERQGFTEEAEALHRRVFTGYEKALGPEHPWTLISVNNLGSVLERQGKFEEAEAMHRRSFIGYEKVLGPEHPDALISASNFGLMLMKQDKCEESEAIYRLVLEEMEKILGLEHLWTLMCVNNLGSVLERQGKYEEAEAMHRRAFVGYEKVQGPEHPDTLISIKNLGLVLKRQSKYDGIVALY